jgi:NADPH:quinone reductase-like Zn-dependent oxidoreductase/NAD(P)-dependent dehydrogenase (short-subunit alcohol dehydrogenase family)/acyl carrier protein
LTLLDVLALVQELVPYEDLSRLALVTRGAQSLSQRPRSLSPFQAAIWGLGRTIINEFPKFQCQMIDLDPSWETPRRRLQETQALFDELLASDREDEIAFRNGKRFIHRLRKTKLLTIHPPVSQEQAVGADNFRLEIAGAGTLDHLLLRRTERRPPKIKDLEIQVHAAGLNFSDVMKALNLYPGLPEGSVPLGIECAGIVERTGKHVKAFHPGDRVMALAPFSFGAYVTAPEDFVSPIPSGMDFPEAASLPVAFLTAAYGLIHAGRLQKGERILIHSASGGVGLAAVQIAKHIGAEVYATAGTPKKRAFLKKMGIRCVMDSRSLAFAGEIMDQTDGEGIDVVLNSLSGEAISKGLSVLRPYGRFLEIGKRDIYRNRRIGLLPFQNNLSFFSIDMDKVMGDCPDLTGRLLRQLSEDFSKGVFSALPIKKFPISKIREAFRTMARAGHIGKIIVTVRGHPVSIAPAARTKVQFKSNGSYLITGGFGGFGISTAKWMVDNGARNIALMGRRGADAIEARNALKEMKDKGAQILEIKGDISKKKDAREALGAIQKRLPPLRGVIHAAMVLDDAALINQTPERLMKAVNPKILGACHLHTLTKTSPLDFFVLFSSISSLIGMPGQGNYAAANAFLDGLSDYRRSLGLPSITINWGYLGQVGVAARNQMVADRFQNYGLRSFSPAQALELLARFLEFNPVQMAVMNMDWTRFGEFFKSYAVSPKFSELWNGEAPKTKEADGSRLQETQTLRNLLLAPGEKDIFHLLKNALREQVARISGTEASQLDEKKPLTELGFDSLMAVELRNWAESKLRIGLPSVEILRGPSIEQLALKLKKAFVVVGTTVPPKESA